MLYNLRFAKLPNFVRIDERHTLKRGPAGAGREGFEPPLACAKAVFKTAAINRSATCPIVIIRVVTVILSTATLQMSRKQISGLGAVTFLDDEESLIYGSQHELI